MTLLTAVNDSMFRWMIMPVGRGVLQSRFSLSTDEAGSVILALGLGIFMLPFVIFAPWAGWASDRFSKRSSIICMKVAELLLVFVGVFSIRTDSVALMFLVLFLLGVQATLIGTTKLGIIPEIVRRRDISSANGWSGLATLVGVIVGTVAGYGLGDSCVATPARGHFLALLSLAGTAVFGLVGAIMIRRVPAANPEVRFHWNLVTDSLRDASLIVSHKQILRITLGIVFFWSIASMGSKGTHLSERPCSSW